MNRGARWAVGAGPRSVPPPGLPDTPARPARARGGNLGRTTQPRRHRAGCPMAAYDALPSALRGWLARAALPWSPASGLRIWRRLRARGLPVAARLAALDRAEARALAREAEAGPAARTTARDAGSGNRRLLPPRHRSATVPLARAGWDA